MPEAALQERLKKVPLRPGVYLFKNAAEQVIYVGKAKRLRNRLRSYFQSPEGLQVKVRALMTHVTDFDYIVTGSEMEALILENNLIKSYQPRYNIDLRDDKSYPYLKLTGGESFPRAVIVREKKKAPHKYFGPYTSVINLKTTLKVLRSVFPLRTCIHLKQHSRPCLNYDLGLCLAPCAGKVTEAEYQTAVEGLISFLEGKTDLVDQLEQDMKAAAETMNFEQAAVLRNQWLAMKAIDEKAQIDLNQEQDLDMIGFLEGERENLVQVFIVRHGRITGKDTYWLKKPLEESVAEAVEFFLRSFYADNLEIPAHIYISHLPEDTALLESWLQQLAGHGVELKIPKRGEKRTLLDRILENARTLWEEKHQENLKQKQILKELAEKLELEVLPQRIECYDISHLAGTETVASMVVFTGGAADNKAYRRFKIKQEQNDDFASLQEAITRRFDEARKGNAAFLPEPDLLLIDGGLGQVNAVSIMINQLGVELPIRGLAKKNEEIYFPGQGTPLRLSRRDSSLQLLQRVRDEAHRFAISYNRQRRSMKLTRSALDDIPGVGAKRKQALLQAFGSAKALAAAEVESIAQVEGINEKLAQSIWLYFRQSKEGQ